MWKTSVKHNKCALSFKMDNGTTHAIACMKGIFKGLDLGMATQYFMYLLFEFPFAQAVDDPDLYLPFSDSIIKGRLQRLQLKLDGIFIVFLSPFKLCAIYMQIYLLAKHRCIRLAATHRISRTHHIAAQEACIEFL
jgi:hypothetical protein